MSQKKVATTAMASQKKMKAVKGASEMSDDLTCKGEHVTKCMISLSTRTSD
jgi:hypothetical protein